MTAAFFGLLGVVVGGVLNATLAARLEGRKAARAQQTSARLLAEEIDSNARTLWACRTTGLWLAMRNHPLRFEAWEAHAETLACIPYADWVRLADAVRLTTQIDRVHGGDRTHTKLSPMDPGHLLTAEEASATAAAVLERHARGSDAPTPRLLPATGLGPEISGAGGEQDRA